MCDYTNGNLYFYKNFRLEAHYKNIFNQIRKCFTRINMLEAVVRTRFSKGYKISNFITPVLISNNDLLICSNLDSDQSFTVGLDLNDTDPTVVALSESEQFIYLQVRLTFILDSGALYSP